MRAYTKKNTNNGSSKSITGRLVEKRRRRVQQRRAARQEAAITWAKGHQIYALPLVISLACLVVAVLAHTTTPTVALWAGAVVVVVIGAGAGFTLDARREHVLVATHVTVGMCWVVAAAHAGIDAPWIWPTGLIIALAAQVSWLDQRASKHTTRGAVTRTLADLWNDPDNGVLHRAGVDGARMVGHSIVRNNDGTPIGDDYEIDLSHSKTGQDAFALMGQTIAEKLPGKVRRGAVNVFPDADEVNHATVRAIWVTPWKPASVDPKGIIAHPVVEHLPELQTIVLNAIERRSNPELEPVPIPAHLKPWLPQMRSYVDPLPVGQREDRSTFYRQNYKKKFGVLHMFCMAETGGGKTSFINSEISSALPCRDVLFWVIDVSAKAGQDFVGWGSCIDWMATSAEDAVAMLKAAFRVAHARGEAYRNENGSVRSPKQAPTIKLVIDELSALYDELDTEVYTLLKPLVRQGRTQGVQVQMYDQSGAQVGNLYGLKELLRQMHTRAVLKVDSHDTMKQALRMPDAVPYNMATAPEGVTAYEDHQAPRPDVLRCYYTDTGDPDEGHHGVIPAIASLYAPFRTVLDEVSAHAAGEPYAQRDMTREDNPLITPTEFAMSHAPVNPVFNEDDLEENHANIRTGADWLDALLRGDLTMSTPDTSMIDTSGDGDDANDLVANVTQQHTPDDDMQYTPYLLLKKQGVPMSDGPRARQERRELLNARHAEKSAQIEATFAELDAMRAESNVDDVGLHVLETREAPQNYPDSDKIMSAALELLRTQAAKGTTTRAIAEAAGVRKTDTVMPRMRWLLHSERVVRRGNGRAARWYTPSAAPAEDTETN